MITRGISRLPPGPVGPMVLLADGETGIACPPGASGDVDHEHHAHRRQRGDVRRQVDDARAAPSLDRRLRPFGVAGAKVDVTCFLIALEAHAPGRLRVLWPR